MSIDWETGKVTDEQHLLRPEQTSPVIKDLPEGGVAYLDADHLGADSEGGLWLYPHAASWTDEEARAFAETRDLCRVIRVEAGFIVDVSEGSFRLGGESGDTVETDASLNIDGQGFIPVVGLIETSEQRTEAGVILWQEYEMMLGRSALAESEAQPDESFEQGDEETPA